MKKEGEINMPYITSKMVRERMREHGVGFKEALYDLIFEAKTKIAEKRKEHPKHPPKPSKEEEERLGKKILGWATNMALKTYCPEMRDFNDRKIWFLDYANRYWKRYYEGGSTYKSIDNALMMAFKYAGATFWGAMSTFRNQHNTLAINNFPMMEIVHFDQEESTDDILADCPTILRPYVRLVLDGYGPYQIRKIMKISVCKADRYKMAVRRWMEGEWSDEIEERFRKAIEGKP